MKRTSAAVVALLVLVPAARSQNVASIKQRLDVEVPKAYSDIRELGKNVTIHVREKLFDNDAKKTERRTEQVVAVSNGFVLSRLEVPEAGESKVNGVRRPAVIPTVLCKNSRYSFRLERPQLGAEWVLKEWSPAEKVQENNDMATIYEKARRYSHFMILNKPLPDFLNDPTFQIKSGEYFDRDGRQFLRVFFTQGNLDAKDPKEAVLLDGSITLDTKFWCVSESEFKMTSRFGKGSRRVTNEYAPNAKGIALPVRTTSILLGPSTNNESVFEFRIEEHQGLPEADFTLTAFGFPEPMGMPPVNRTSTWWIWLMGVGLACVVGAGFWFRRIQRRKMQQTQRAVSGNAASG